MITQNQAEELRLDEFDYDGVANDTADTSDYEVGVMGEYEDEYYLEDELKELIATKIQEYKDDMEHDEIEYSEFDLENIEDEVLDKTTYYVSLFITKETYDKYLTNGDFLFDCINYIWRTPDNEDECHVYILGDNRENVLYTINSFYEHIEYVDKLED